MPLLSLSIPQDCHCATVASIVAGDSLGALSLPLPPPTPPLSLLIPQTHISPPTSLSSSSIPWDRCCAAAASVVIANPSGLLSLPLPLATTLSSSSIPRIHIAHPTPPPLSLIHRAPNCAVAASFAVTDPSGLLSTNRIHRLFVFLHCRLRRRPQFHERIDNQ